MNVPSASPLYSTRRWFCGSLGAALIGTRLAQACSLQAAEETGRRKSCILLWLGGAPSQLEMWDPKPGTANGGSTKAISTAVPGVQIAHYWPRLAKKMSSAAIIRTVVGKEAAHERGTYHLHTGRRLTGGTPFPNLGSVVAHELGDPQSDLPNFVSVGSTLSAGYLGVRFAPFAIEKPGELPENVAALAPDPQLARRLELLAAQEADFASAGARRLVDERQALYTRAYRMMRSPRLPAFQLDSEKEATRAAYGNSRFGQGVLVARRLVEAGVPFVEVQRGGWDMHNDLVARFEPAAADVDQALAALLDDLKERGLLGSTLVICMGEFGRTPKLNSRSPKPGRDHWIRCFNVLLAGAGIRGGAVVGKTSANGQEVSDRAVSVEDLFQTFCRALEIQADKELYTPESRPVKIVDGGAPVKELLGTA
ncbi:MAG: DUF1501 domain-containing protein [Pirellulales bacterium]